MTQTNSTPLVFDNVGFRYDREQVLSDFSLNLEAGQVTLLAAPNGAGKTTAVWLAAGLLRPDTGSVAVFGRDPAQERKVLGRVGFLGEGAPLPQRWTGRQVLDFQRDTFPEFDDTECKRLIERFAVNLKQRVKQMSRGERGKLALTTVLSTRPSLLLLDEPTLGLDVATRRLLATELLGNMASVGCSILLAGHEIAEAERTADRMVFIQDGKVECDEPVAQLLERHRLLTWDDRTSSPPGVLDPVALPDRLGHRALARQWNREAAAPWLAAGGREVAADLETIYLSMTGDLSYA